MRASAGRGARSSSSGGGNQTGLLVGIGAVAVVAVMFFVFSGGGAKDAGQTPAENPATKTPAAKTPDVKAPPELVGDDSPRSFATFGKGAGKPGKVPITPAPEIDVNDVVKADAALRAAKLKWNDAQRARTAGDHVAFKEHLDAATIAMRQSRAAIETYTDWLEEADLSGWALPASYVDLQKELGPQDQLFQKIKKVNPNH